MKQHRKAAVALAAVTLLVSACSSTGAASNTATTTGSAASSPSKPITIGLANQTLAVTFPVAIGEGAQKAADELGVKLVQLDSQNSEQKMASQVQDLIAQGVNGIVLVPINPGTSKSLVDAAATASIPVGSAHNYVGDNGPKNPVDKLDFAILEDEQATGQKAADIAQKVVPKGGKVGIVLGQAGMIENDLRTALFKSTLKATGKYEVVAEQPGDWTKEKGQAACQNLLAANPDMALFYALSDDMAVGCAQAVKSAGSDAKIIGVGGSKLGIQAIADGSISGTVCYKPFDNGYQAVKTMYDIIVNGKRPTERTIFYDTPAITKDNIADCKPQW